MYSQDTNIMRVTIILLLFFFTIQTVKASIPSTEKQALIDLYNALDGNQWAEPWDLTKPVSNWKGVTVINNTVVAIKLTNNNLKGVLPESIGDLTNLRVLNLHKNQIEGNIPSSIGNLNTLIHLNLSLNNLQGNIPNEITHLKNLEYLYLFFNDFTGSLMLPAIECLRSKNVRIYGTELHIDTTNLIVSL